MKNYIFLFVLFPFVGFAQIITGKITDNQNQKLALVSLEIETSNQKTIDLQSDENGYFSFDLEEATSFILYIKEFGFLEFQKEFDTKNLNNEIEIILEKDETIALSEVKLTNKKPMIKRKIDRLEFNIQDTPLQNLSAWDILKNTPNVILKNDQLSVRGNTQILVTINDKKTLMSQDQLKQLLENTEGSTVSSVEVITNPPGKYEASGSAIINIKMTKNSLDGYKGQVYTRYHQATYAKYMLGSSHSFNKKKWQLSGSYYFVNGDYVRKNFDVVTYEKERTQWESDMVRKTSAKEQHIYNFSSQYNLDSLTTFQFGSNGYNNPKSLGNYKVPTNIYNLDNHELEANYLTQNNRREYNNSINAYFGIDKKLGKHTINWLSNFSKKHYKENQEVLTLLNFGAESENYFQNNSIQNIELYSTQVDYNFSDEKYSIESGLKYSFVKNNNDLKFYEKPNQEIIYNPEKSNLFDYQEQIFAAYISSNYKWNKWEAKAGLRSETTWIKTESDNPITENKINQTKIFPTFYLTYETENQVQFGLSYGKRISRPNYDFLNPSKSYYNLFSYFQGDANMKSTIIHNLSLSYTLKNWNFETYYRYEKDPAMEISIQNPKTFETMYYFTNIKNGEAYGFNISKSFSFSKNWKMNLFSMVEYNKNFFFGTDQVLYKNDVVFYHLNLNSQIDLDEDKTWNLSAGYVYNSPMIQGSFNISSSQNTYVIINNKLWDKKIEIGLTLNDIFRTDRNTIKTNYADQNQHFKDYRDTQYFLINLKYNFGNQKVKDVKQNSNTDEQNRI